MERTSNPNELRGQATCLNGMIAAIAKQAEAFSLERKRKADFDWFVSEYENLKKEYEGYFLAIKGKTVLGRYSSYAEAVMQTSKTEPMGTFIVQEVSTTRKAYETNIGRIRGERDEPL